MRMVFYFCICELYKTTIERFRLPITYKDTFGDQIVMSIDYIDTYKKKKLYSICCTVQRYFELNFSSQSSLLTGWTFNDNSWKINYLLLFYLAVFKIVFIDLIIKVNKYWPRYLY